MGLRGKIALAFAALGAVMLFSVMVSLFELKNLNSATTEIFETSTRVINLSQRMLNAVQEQNIALLQILIGYNYAAESDYIKGKEEFEEVLSEVAATVMECRELDLIYIARDNYHRMIDNYLAGSDREEISQFLDIYKISYTELTSAINSYMYLSHSSFASMTSELESNAYRAIAPGILTLVVVVLIMTIFFALFDLYYIRPVLNITKSLEDYMNHKIPFNPKFTGKDEIHSLHRHIETLISELKKKVEGTGKNNQTL